MARCMYEDCEEEATTFVDMLSGTPVCKKHQKLARCKVLIFYGFTEKMLVDYGYGAEYEELSGELSEYYRERLAMQREYEEQLNKLEEFRKKYKEAVEDEM